MWPDLSIRSVQSTVHWKCVGELLICLRFADFNHDFNHDFLHNGTPLLLTVIIVDGWVAGKYKGGYSWSFHAWIKRVDRQIKPCDPSLLADTIYLSALQTGIIFKVLYMSTGCTLYYYKWSAVAEMGDRLATIDMDRKLGGCAPLGRGSWVPI